MGKPLTYLAVAFFFAATAVPAIAQPEFSKENITKIIRKVGIHANVGEMKPFADNVTKGLTKGVSVGLAPGVHNGWKFPVGISWYSEDLNGPTGTQFATLRANPVLAGIGYGWHFADGKLATSAAMQVGYSFNKVSRAGDPVHAFASGDPVSISVGNSVLYRPRLQAEYFLSTKFTLRSTLSYIIMRPDVVVTTAAGRMGQTWKADGINASVGVGFYPLRKQ